MRVAIDRNEMLTADTFNENIDAMPQFSSLHRFSIYQDTPVSCDLQPKQCPLIHGSLLLTLCLVSRGQSA